MKIGLISDTHGFLDEKIFSYFGNCDEIWHAGDIGNKQIIDALMDFKPIQAVYGNMDGNDIRSIYSEDLWIDREGFKILLTHIGGYPPKYNKRVKKILMENTPGILVCGHSHILKIMTDKSFDNLLYLNPGAAGREGFHKVRTLIRFEISSKTIKNMEVIELGKRA